MYGVPTFEAGRRFAFRRRSETALLDEARRRRLLAAEVDVELVRVDGAAARQDRVAGLLAVRCGHAAALLEPLERVGGEDGGPQIGVVAGCITAAPDVREVRRVIPRWD